MKASTSVLVAAFVCAVCIVGVVGILTVDTFDLVPSARRDARERDAALTRTITELRERLEWLESRSERRDARSAVSEETERSVSIEEGTESESEGEPLALRVDALESELRSIETQIRALSEDPVSRGFEYVASPNGELRRRGIEMLRRLGRSDPQALAAIRNLLDDPDTRVREEALEALAEAGDRESIPSILGLLGDAEAGVRNRAIESLSELLEDADASDPQVQAAAVAIAERLSDPESNVRRQAADALGDFPGQTTVSALIRSLDDAHEEVREHAIDSLAGLEASSAVPRLREMYDRGAGGLGVDLAVALRRLGDPAPFDVEVARLSQIAISSADERERRGAVRTLGRFEARELRGVLERALQDPSQGVRREAEEALEELDG
jgi:HEAT repeat protein